MSKIQVVKDLLSRNLAVRQIALLVYNDDSEKAQNRVWALISKLRKGRKPQPQPCKFPNPTPARRITDAIKKAETAQKGKSSMTVLNWLDQDMLAKQLADECYEHARKCVKEGKLQDGCRLLGLVAKFLKLSQSARKEFDIEELKRMIVEEKRP